MAVLIILGTIVFSILMLGVFACCKSSSEIQKLEDEYWSERELLYKNERND